MEAILTIIKIIIIAVNAINIAACIHDSSNAALISAGAAAGIIIFVLRYW